MATYRELLNQVKAEIDEVSSPDLHDRLAAGDRPLLLDVREQDEWDEGHLPGAIHVARGNLEARIEAVIPDKAREVVIYCAAGARSAFVAKSMLELGYTDVASMSGGFSEWKHNGYSLRDAARTEPGAARALLTAHSDSRGRRGRTAEAARRTRAPDRRGRPRLALVALPRSGGRRNARHHRCRHRRRLEPPAPDRPLDEHARRAEGAVGEAGDRGAQPRRARWSRIRSA